MTLYQPITNVHRLHNIIHGIAYIPNHSPHFSIFSFFFMHLFAFLSPVGVYLSNPVCLHQSFMNKKISSNSHILASRSFLPSFLPSLPDLLGHSVVLSRLLHRLPAPLSRHLSGELLPLAAALPWRRPHLVGRHQRQTTEHQTQGTCTACYVLYPEPAN